MAIWIWVSNGTFSTRSNLLNRPELLSPVPPLKFHKNLSLDQFGALFLDNIIRNSPHVKNVLHGCLHVIFDYLTCRRKKIQLTWTKADAWTWLIFSDSMILTCTSPANETTMYQKFRGHPQTEGRQSSTHWSKILFGSLIEKTKLRATCVICGSLAPSTGRLTLYCTVSVIRTGLFAITPWWTWPLKKYRKEYHDIMLM